MNAYNMLELLRDQVGEGTASHWSDVNLVRRLNAAQRKVAVLVGSYPGSWLVKSVDLTPSSSVITLPQDCSKPLYLEETSSGKPLTWLENVKGRRVSRLPNITGEWYGGGLEAYPLRNTLVVNQDSYATEVTLWYEQRVPDLVVGTGTTGSAATALYFPDDVNTKRVDDYYNGVGFETEEGTGAGTVGDSITDFVGSSRKATVTGTYGTDSVFGTISLLPEEAHYLIVLEATVLALAKPSSNIDEKVFGYYLGERKEAKRDLERWLETRIKGYGRVAITEEGI